MVEGNRSYGICGVYCGQCPNGNGRVKFSAGELRRLVDTVRYEWLNYVEKSFSFDEFRKGLEWFANAQCPMCLNGGGAPCENKKCAKTKGLESCLLCDDYLACRHTEYHRDFYPFVVDNYRRVKEVGFKKHLEEEEERAKAGVDMVGHLERRCCKTLKLGEK
jgi:transcription elongation factor Elf1